MAVSCYFALFLRVFYREAFSSRSLSSRSQRPGSPGCQGFGEPLGPQRQQVLASSPGRAPRRSAAEPGTCFAGMNFARVNYLPVDAHSWDSGLSGEKTLPLNGGFRKSQPLVLAQMIIDAKWTLRVGARARFFNPKSLPLPNWLRWLPLEIACIFFFFFSRGGKNN